MPVVLRILALALGLVTLALWFFGGMNLGRTVTRVAIERVDATTGRQEQVWERRFLPGIEFLATGLAGAGLLFVAGRQLARRKSE